LHGPNVHLTSVLQIFYLWRHLNFLVYSTLNENDDTPRQHGFYACQTISSNTSTFERVQQSMIRHVHVCIDSGGGHFEHLL